MESRTKNAIKNLKSGIINNVISILTPFVIRTVMIKALGADYLGLNSLFTSILQVLNMAELGISSAIVFSMYQPLAEKNTEKVCALLNLYKKLYSVIGIIVLVVGVLLTPFLKYLINGSYPDEINLYIIYLIYLGNASLSYFLYAYKSSLLNAVQKQSIINDINILLVLARFVYQLIVLVVLKDYYIYLIGNIGFTIIYNLLISRIAKKKYPQYICKGEVDIETKEQIKTQVKGLVIGKISYLSRNSFDSIALSAFCGLSTVVVYSNYYYICSSVLGIILVIGQSITAGVGNRIATASLEENYRDFKKFNFYYCWIGTWFTISLLCIYQPFMNLWVGKKLMADFYVMVLFVIYFFITQLGQCRSVYVAAAGIWWETRYVQIAEMIGNLILNFALGYFWGMTGILLATIVTSFIFGVVGQGIIAFQTYFKRSAIEYFRDNISWTICFGIAGYLSYKLASVCFFNSVFAFIWAIIVSIIVPNVIFILYSLLDKEKRTFFMASKRYLYQIIRR